QVWRYVCDHTPEHPALRACRERTAEHPRAEMQIAPEQGGLMALLTRLIGAQRYLEVGTFTGYSALAVTLAMGDTGHATCCDVSEEFTDLAQRSWDEAGVRERIDLRIAPALDTLDALRSEGRENAYDLAFIDADKQPTLAYYEHCLALVRPGGLVMLDNCLHEGRVADPDDLGTTSTVMREANAFFQRDPRVEATLIPIADGLHVARKK
ncbi:MAG: class I SAM-dependent methyltransferase, partial [Planctomycetota bacterium]